ncbi:uncharacterized protein LOC130725503 [Lotus japonicus]|uniref:uncharacterized protein LOC130725503 n=1 Tax=Lotus japonicus TaxID=34305 RepID=UPI0025895620|nr:uncharacterized protein LOC130725503 [Lotus japonicus]
MSSLGRYRYEVQGKVWRPKVQPVVREEGVALQHKKQQVQQEERPQQEGSHLSFNLLDLNEAWVQRCAHARTIGSMSVDILQESFSSIGLYNFRLILLGAKEVLLEFETKEEMQSTITECRYFLEHYVTDVTPCTIFTFGASQLVWIRLWQVPLGLWTQPFFSTVGNRLGTYVMSDDATTLRHRIDYARILVRMNHPLLNCFTMSVDVEGTSCIVLVEKDAATYDYGRVEVMPSTPVKEYVLDESSDDESMNDGIATTPEAAHEKDYESAFDVNSKEEDEIYRNDKMEGLAFLQTEATEEVLCGGMAVRKVAAELCSESPVRDNGDALFSNSKIAPVYSRTQFKEPFKGLVDSIKSGEQVKEQILVVDKGEACVSNSKVTTVNFGTKFREQNTVLMDAINLAAQTREEVLTRNHGEMKVSGEDEGELLCHSYDSNGE